MAFQVPRNHQLTQGQNLGDPNINIETKEPFQMQCFSSVSAAYREQPSRGLRRNSQKARRKCQATVFSPNQATLSTLNPFPLLSEVLGLPSAHWQRACGGHLYSHCQGQGRGGGAEQVAVACNLLTLQSLTLLVSSSTFNKTFFVFSNTISLGHQYTWAGRKPNLFRDELQLTDNSHLHVGSSQGPPFQATQTDSLLTEED